MGLCHIPCLRSGKPANARVRRFRRSSSAHCDCGSDCDCDGDCVCGGVCGGGGGERGVELSSGLSTNLLGDGGGTDDMTLEYGPGWTAGIVYWGWWLVTELNHT